MDQSHSSRDRELNDLNTNIENKPSAALQKRKCFGLTLNINSEGECKIDGKKVNSNSEEIPVPYYLRVRNRKPVAKYFEDSDTSDSDCEQPRPNVKSLKTVKKLCNKRNLAKFSFKDEKEQKEIIGSVGTNMLKYDIKIDPNVVDRYTDVPVQLLSGAVMPPSESPDTKRRRVEKENMVVARQCRLHPANKKYNLGPVVNPPPISPGKMVGYTPAGQRHEVDLNNGRPTWFNSEYARMQFDDATKINVSRMFHDMENGSFLPDGLDPNVERRHFAERALVSADAAKHFEKLKIGSNNGSSDSDTALADHMSFLETEKQLLELNMFAAVRLTDFSDQVANKLTNALTWKLTPLMFKKNPLIIEVLEKLSIERTHVDVVRPARALLNKIKDLFEVPKGQTFKEYFAFEVEDFIRRTKNMSPFDVLMMTKEPDEEPEISSEEEEIKEENILQNSEESDEENENDEWIPAEGGYWEDAMRVNDENSAISDPWDSSSFTIIVDEEDNNGEDSGAMHTVESQSNVEPLMLSTIHEE
ncbi:uncharacterized protein LOC124352759 isoform X2 [Homalodisca vitripennis]|uniref:uncharacterized protein LOC124352759 isoform X2 n=1 Tax=Homalodisca vitripennis TaxID=197043 RepID=UPI001EEC57DD|nr:uncharacterized protein LOC124352759 isoform X2 [Homalodisca vitripennis]KAG8318643.1 PC4 and SFRS1-interacting protein, variant 2 [Homalodisca vitripennis]